MERIVTWFSELSWLKAVGVAIVVSGLYYVLLFDSGTTARQKLENVKNELTLAQGQLKEVVKARADERRFEEEAKTIESDFKSMMNSFPTDMNSTTLQTVVGSKAAAVGLTISKIEPQGAPTRDTFFEVHRCQFQMAGSFVSVALFLASLTKAQEFVTVDKLELRMVEKVGNDIGKLVFSGIISGYRALSESEIKKPQIRGQNGAR